MEIVALAAQDAIVPPGEQLVDQTVPVVAEEGPVVEVAPVEEVAPTEEIGPMEEVGDDEGDASALKGAKVQGSIFMVIVNITTVPNISEPSLSNQTNPVRQFQSSPARLKQSYSTY